MAEKNKGNNEKKAPGIKVVIDTIKRDWSLKDGLKTRVIVKVLADRLENGSDLGVRFLAPDHKILRTTKTNRYGKCSYTISTPLNKIQDIIKYSDGNIKIGVEVELKQGSDTNTWQKKYLAWHDIEVNLPAGGVVKGLITAFIRKWKHLADFVKATSIAFFSLMFISLAGNGQINSFFGFITGLLLFGWWSRKKKTGYVVTGTVITFLMFLLCYYQPDFFTDPLIVGICLAYFCGIPFYSAEEIFRRPDGKALKNFYPWWPMGIGIVAILFFSVDIFVEFIPKKNSLNMARAGWHLAWILRLAMMEFILLIYGGTGELADWFKSKKGKAEAVSVTGTAGFFVILSEFWNIIKEFLPILGRRKKRLRG